MYWITGILGILLIIAPFVLGYSADMPALWSDVVLGLAVLIVSAIKGLIPDTTRWEYVIAGLGGLLAILAPFVLHFSVLATALWASIILGVVVLVLAIYEVYALSARRTHQPQSKP